MRLVFVVILLAGCAPTLHWRKEGASARDFAQASWECAQQTAVVERRAGLSRGTGFYREDSTVDKARYRLCLETYGYERTDPAGWQGLRD